MIGRARSLRRRSPFPERLLWGRLRDRRCGGWKFRRQQPIGRYVVDFYCEQAKLVIELDGHSHASTGVYDQRREEDLLEQGYQVLRFTDDRVLRDVSGVVTDIEMTCRGRCGEETC
ncbi:MAG: endonuclease domain-containing protein [Phycisphaerae bacterium]